MIFLTEEFYDHHSSSRNSTIQKQVYQGYNLRAELREKSHCVDNVTTNELEFAQTKDLEKDENPPSRPSTVPTRATHQQPVGAHPARGPTDLPPDQPQTGLPVKHHYRSEGVG